MQVADRLARWLEFREVPLVWLGRLTGRRFPQKPCERHGFGFVWGVGWKLLTKPRNPRGSPNHAQPRGDAQGIPGQRLSRPGNIAERFVLGGVSSLTYLGAGGDGVESIEGS